MVEGEMKKGRVKFYNARRGFGFITPDDGSKDLFFHQSAIEIEGLRSLADVESVKFRVKVGKDGRAKAENVTRPGGGSVQGKPRGGRLSNGDSSSSCEREFTDGGVWPNDSPGNKERVEKNWNEPDVEVHQKMIIIKVGITVAMMGTELEEKIFVQ